MASRATGTGKSKSYTDRNAIRIPVITDEEWKRVARSPYWNWSDRKEFDLLLDEIPNMAKNKFFRDSYIKDAVKRGVILKRRDRRPIPSGEKKGVEVFRFAKELPLKRNSTLGLTKQRC